MRLTLAKWKRSGRVINLNPGQSFRTGSTLETRDRGPPPPSFPAPAASSTSSFSFFSSFSFCGSSPLSLAASAGELKSPSLSSQTVVSSPPPPELLSPSSSMLERWWALFRVLLAVAPVVEGLNGSSEVKGSWGREGRDGVV